MLARRCTAVGDPPTLSQRLAVAAVEFDPRSALEWSLKITTPSLRNDLSQHTFKAWSRSDPKIAQQWANDHQFSPDN